MILPGKDGFNSIKPNVTRQLGGGMRHTSWNLANPPEYGFYANGKPKVDHTRWSQAQERRLGEFRMRPTLIFNGYGDQVASLYSGMDLRKQY